MIAIDRSGGNLAARKFTPAVKTPPTAANQPFYRNHVSRSMIMMEV